MYNKIEDQGKMSLPWAELSSSVTTGPGMAYSALNFHVSQPSSLLRKTHHVDKCLGQAGVYSVDLDTFPCLEVTFVLTGFFPPWITMTLKFQGKVALLNFPTGGTHGTPWGIFLTYES